MVEFALNSSINATTGYAPFVLNVRAKLMTKPQLEISQRLGADKGQYPTGAVGILSL